MPLSIPAELKRITPYIRRAEELDRDKTNAESRLVAYYCRQYAVHTGIPLAQSDGAKNCLGEILGALEGEKEAMDSFTRDEAKFLCSSFAEKIFSKADTEDRSGQATRDTAKTFYAAGSFLGMLQQFYQDDDETEEFLEIKEKMKYAKWKATDIQKAIKEGREPAAGGYGENLDGEAEELKAIDKETEIGQVEVESLEIPTVETASDDGKEEDESEPVDLAVAPLAPPAHQEKDCSEKDEQRGTEICPPPPYPTPEILPPPSVAPAPAPLRPPMTFSTPAPPPPMPAPSVPRSVAQPAPEKKANIFAIDATKGKKLSKAQFADAKELTQFALAALEDKNSDLAAERLLQALQVLGR